MATLTFLGATGTVTGSKYLLEAGGERLMIDCGLFQGERELRERKEVPSILSQQGVLQVEIVGMPQDYSLVGKNH